jgi:hypothetical protein
MFAFQANGHVLWLLLYGSRDKKKTNKRVEELMKKKRGAFSGDLLSIFTW